MMHCSTMPVPGMRKFALCQAPCVQDVPDTGPPWASLAVLLDLQAHRINADQGGWMGSDRQAPIYRKQEKISVGMTGEPVAF